MSVSALRGSDRLRSLYLDETRSGVAWLVDPDNPVTLAMLRGADTRLPTDACDPEALAADLDDLRRLLLERHIAFATGELRVDELVAPIDELLDGWRRRLRDDRPSRWGEATGVELQRLRSRLHDRHASVRGEDPDRLAALDPRVRDRGLADEGPIVEEHRHGDVLALRIRGFAGSPSALAELAAWRADHGRHFTHERIVVDLRGNGGGDDSYTWDWMRAHVAREVAFADAFAWRVDGRLLGSWAAWVRYRAVHGADNAGARGFADRAFTPSPASRLELVGERDVLGVGPDPWTGRMLVIIDGGVASSGESSAVILRDGLGARVIGGPSHGSMAYGNLAFYPLARSGLVLRLATTTSGLGVPEFTGIPVDAPLADPGASSAAIAADFDRHWDAAAAVARMRSADREPPRG